MRHGKNQRIRFAFERRFVKQLYISKHFFFSFSRPQTCHWNETELYNLVVVDSSAECAKFRKNYPHSFKKLNADACQIEITVTAPDKQHQRKKRWAPEIFLRCCNTESKLRMWNQTDNRRKKIRFLFGSIRAVGVEAFISSFSWCYIFRLFGCS